MEKKVSVYCNTKRFEGDDAVRTKLTVDFSGLTDEDILALATDSAIIKWQAGIRRKKDAIVPSEATYVVPKPGTRAATTMTPFEHVCELFGKQRIIDAMNKTGASADEIVDKFMALAEELGLE